MKLDFGPIIAWWTTVYWRKRFGPLKRSLCKDKDNIRLATEEEPRFTWDQPDHAIQNEQYEEELREVALAESLVSKVLTNVTGRESVASRELFLRHIRGLPPSGIFFLGGSSPGYEQKVTRKVLSNVSVVGEEKTSQVCSVGHRTTERLSVYVR